MMDNDSEAGFLEPVLQSEVVMVMCNGCGTEQPVNVVYAPYVTNGISSCRACREKMYGSSESGG
jgi:peptide methionine sulfoxide reductase MsrB